MLDNQLIGPEVGEAFPQECNDEERIYYCLLLVKVHLTSETFLFKFC